MFFNFQENLVHTPLNSILLSSKQVPVVGTYVLYSLTMTLCVRLTLLGPALSIRLREN